MDFIALSWELKIRVASAMGMRARERPMREAARHQNFCLYLPIHYQRQTICCANDDKCVVFC